LKIQDYEETSVKTVSKDDPIQKMVLETLAKLGGDLVQEDALKFQGTEMILPETMEGNIGGVIRYLNDYTEQQEQKHSITRTFKYRPYDGANAVQRALKKVFGSTGIGRTTYSFFGASLPEFRSVDVGPHEQIQVPWGQVSFAPLSATLWLTETQDKDLGPLFHLQVDAPRKFRGHVEGLFVAIEAELREHSIYKGKAIDGAVLPGFIDPFRTDSSRVVYSHDVQTQLSANVWSLIEYTSAQRRLGLPLKRTCLIEGPYGTGKSLAATLTAQKAVRNGWTFVFNRPGVDSLEITMKTANLYAPAVVFFEDIDVIAERGDSDTVSKLLDLFDSITNKGAEILCILTTNHVERIHKAMLRPGRLDSVIHIGALDSAGYEALIKANVPTDMLDPDTDYGRIGSAMAGFMPAFAKEASDRALRYAVDRTGGDVQMLTTDDFVEAAEGLKPQLDLMNEAGEGVKTPQLVTAMAETVAQAVHGTGVLDRDGDKMFSLSSEAKDLAFYSGN
jgi:transitional endoplasmic reticulum ATPase